MLSTTEWENLHLLSSFLPSGMVPSQKQPLVQISPIWWLLFTCIIYYAKFDLLQVKKVHCKLSDKRSKKFAWYTKLSKQKFSSKFNLRQCIESYNLIFWYDSSQSDGQIRKNRAIDLNAYWIVKWTRTVLKHMLLWYCVQLVQSVSFSFLIRIFFLFKTCSFCS